MSSTNLATQYQKKTDKEHILDNPDTYIGSIENVNGHMYILDEDKIVQKEIDYNPALFKLFDEGIVNCRDHVIRCEKNKKDNSDVELVSLIEITISNNCLLYTSPSPRDS